MRIAILGTFLIAEVLLVGLLAGCGATFDYDALRAADARGPGFSAALGRQYKDFALFETDQMMDWPDAAHFGGKALDATAGSVPEPEKLADWRLPKARVGELTAARARLVAALAGGAGERWPETAAVAQARFDCWIEQQEENWQWDDIAACRDGFHGAIDEIEQAIASSDAAARKNLQPAALRTENPVDPTLPRAYLVLFDFDSDQLTGDGLDAVNAVAEAARDGQGVRIVVSGHADRAGPEPYNEGLSWRRAETLSHALIDAGVSPKLITVNAFGERRPLVATPDGIREPRNRRVEITVGPASEL